MKPYASAYPTPFVGRTKEMADLTACIINPDCRLLTITGLGGSGKTRLAREAARVVTPHFLDGIVFVALQLLSRSELLVPAIAQALGLTLYGQDEPQAQLLEYLHDKTLLLILDTFEHLVDGAALVSTLLASTPGITALVTSREGLSLQEEWLYPLTGMTTPLSVYTTALEDYEAVQLFLYHARRAQPRFDLANEHEAVIRICQLTAGLPLAIELAASWLKGSSVVQIAHQMQHALDFLSTSTRNGEPRHRSIRAVFDQSWRLVEENERVIFAKVSVFAGSFDGDAAERVAGASFSSLAGLVEKSLVHIQASGRFGIHEMVRQYGMEQLKAYGETEATYTHHSHYFAQLMFHHEADLKHMQQLKAMRAIERDFDNIRLAWEWSTTHQQVAQLRTMLNALYLFGFLCGRYRETTQMFQETLDQSVDDTRLRGQLLARRWGYLQFGYQVDYQEALTDVEQALTIARAENNQFEIAFCQFMCAYVRISTRRYAEAVPYLESSQALFEALDEPYYVCWVLHRLGYVYFNLNIYTRANEYTEQSLAIARVTHDRVAQATCLYNLGSSSIVNGDYVQGAQYCAEALQVASETGHQDQIAHALSLVALCAFFQKEYTLCQDYAERSRIITEDINLSAFLPYSLSLLILLACLREEYAEGVQLNAVAKHQGTNTMGLQLLYWALAAVSCGIGHTAEARAYIHNVVQLSSPDTSAALTIWLIPCVAYILAATNPEQAVAVLAWILTYPEPALNWAHDWPLLARLQTHLQAAMDRDAYQVHWKRGQALTLDTITSLLRREFGAAPDAASQAAPSLLLSPREHEILRLMATGLTNPQIAAHLVIGAGTVKTHTLHIYRKLEVANRTQAILRAQELALLDA